MSENSLVPLNQNPEFLSQADLQAAMELLLYSLSASSKRIYANTFAVWQRFAESQQFPSFAMSPANLIAFLESEAGIRSPTVCFRLNLGS